jgi:hypothetical protein
VRGSFLGFLFNHFNILFRADRRAVTATLAINGIKIIGILALPGYAAFRTNHKAHIASDAVFLQVLRLASYAPRPGLVVPACSRFT